MLVYHAPLSAYFYAGLIIVCIVLLWLVVYLYIKRVDATVIENSQRLKELDEINEKYTFHFFDSSHIISKQYDNKSHFMKIEPGDLMAQEMRNKLLFYEDAVSKIKENIHLFSE